MHEPKKIPLTDNPRCKEPKKIPLTKIDIETWDKYENNGGPPIFAKQNEDNQHNNTSSIQKLESDETD